METAVIAFGLVVVVGGVLALARYLAKNSRPSAWLRGGGDKRLEAELRKLAGDLAVDIVPYEGERGEKGLRIRVVGLCSGVTLRREAAAPRSPNAPADFGAQMREASETQIGDPRFDAEFFVSGQPALAQAFLNAPARRALLAVLERGSVAELGLVQGELTVAVPGYPTAGGDTLRDVGQAVVEAALLLNPVRDVPARLAQAVREDPQPFVRAQALALLVREYASHPLTLPALRDAAQDADAEVRLRAALALGPEGRTVLVALSVDATAPLQCVLHALEALASDLTYDEARAALEPALARRHLAAARLLLAALWSRGGRPAVPVLADVLDRFSGEVGAAAAAALGATGLPEAETPLLAALAKARDGARLRAIADALGLVGSRGAVAALREVLEGHGDSPVGWAAQRALAEVLARVGGTPGELSLAAGEAGQLALSDDPGGRVSLKPPGDGGER
jgi:HEAT repeat protein